MKNLAFAKGDKTEPLPGQVVLVLQGGGALGSYQAGVYQALHEAGIEPDWIIGTSIGAINASLIAGNKIEQRLARLQEFWKRMKQNTVWSFPDAFADFNEKLSYWSTIAHGIPGFFRPNPLALLNIRFTDNPEYNWHASFGAVVDLKGQTGTDVEPVAGVSFSIRRLIFITPFALHFGRVNNLAGGFKEGDVVPDSIATPPIEKHWKVGYTGGITFRIAPQ